VWGLPQKSCVKSGGGGLAALENTKLAAVLALPASGDVGALTLPKPGKNGRVDSETKGNK
jgi:hypothetical protein